MPTVNTFKWDTVYSARYDIVNDAIMAQKAFPPTFDYTQTYDDEGDITSITINGNWDSWQLYPGGEGNIVRMECKVSTGSVYGDYGKGSLDGSSIIVEIGLENKENADYSFRDDTAKPGTGQAQILLTDILPQGEIPAVVIEYYKFPDIGKTSVLYSILPSAFQSYFIQYISDFKNVFSVIMLNEEAAKENYAWLKPSATSYAVGSTVSGTLEDSVFGILCKAEGNTISGDEQLVVDTAVLQEISDEANSAFAISPEMVTKHMLMEASIATIQGSEESDFEIGKDGVSILNVNEIKWGNFDSGDGIIYSPVIAKGNFCMSLQNDYILLEIVNASFKHAGIVINTTLTQKFRYQSIQRESDGLYVFVPDDDTFGGASIVSTVSVSEGMQIVEIVGSAISIITSFVCACSEMLSAMVNVAEVVEEDAITAVINITEDMIKEVEKEVGKQAVQKTQDETADSVDACLAQSGDGEQVQKGSAAISNKLRTFCGLAKVIGDTSSYALIAKAVEDGNYDDIHDFNEFAANCTGAFIWPGIATADLKSVVLRRSLVIGMKLGVQ